MKFVWPLYSIMCDNEQVNKYFRCATFIDFTGFYRHLASFVISPSPASAISFHVTHLLHRSGVLEMFPICLLTDRKCAYYCLVFTRVRQGCKKTVYVFAFNQPPHGVAAAKLWGSRVRLDACTHTRQLLFANDIIIVSKLPVSVRDHLKRISDMKVRI